MRVRIEDDSVTLWLSASDTWDWAHRRGAAWPGSQLGGRRLVACFDRHGLVDLTIDGGRGDQDVCCDEFNAITSDFLKQKLPQNHPCYFITVGQFQQEPAAA
jgi:hypothetical protein